MSVRVVAFSLAGRWAELDDGVQVPLTNMFDADGEETDDPDLCDRFVAGSDATKWFVHQVADFEAIQVS